MPEAGGELGLTPKALHHLRVTSQKGLQHLESYFPFQVQVAHTVDSAKAAGAEERQELVVVAQSAAEPLFPPGIVLCFRDWPLGYSDDRGFKGSRVAGKVFQHFGCRQ